MTTEPTTNLPPCPLPGCEGGEHHYHDFEAYTTGGGHSCASTVRSGFRCYSQHQPEPIELPEVTDEPTVTGATSDGYHSFDELYEYRMLYNAHAAHGWRAAGVPVVKSWRHSDGEECFGGGWFIVTAELPAGQVSNHYASEHWGLFKVPEVEFAPEWDGHTPADAALRLRIEAEHARPGLVTDEMVEIKAEAERRFPLWLPTGDYEIDREDYSELDAKWQNEDTERDRAHFVQGAEWQAERDAERIAEQTARAEAVEAKLAEEHRDSLAATLIEVQREKLALERAITRVRGLHHPGSVCRHCNSLGLGQRVSWPCPTIQALDGDGAESLGVEA